MWNRGSQGSCFPLVGIIPNYSKVMKQCANINCLFQKDIKKSFAIVCGIQRMFLLGYFKPWKRIVLNLFDLVCSKNNLFSREYSINCFISN